LAQGVFTKIKMFGKKERYQKTKIRTQEATEMTVFRYDSEMWAVRKTEEH
jgi:hypothetical protein